jgi:hypothetical protein
MQAGEWVEANQNAFEITAGQKYKILCVKELGEVTIVNVTSDDGKMRSYVYSVFKSSTSPSHYSSPNGDVWSTVGAFFSEQSRIDHHRLNAVEYIIRCFDKGGVEDLKKAKVNLDRAIELMEDNDA